MNTQDGGPAFPTGNGITPYNTGMSLRDYFAAKALQGMLADPQLNGAPDEWASRSYRLADAMLEARKA